MSWVSGRVRLLMHPRYGSDGRPAGGSPTASAVLGDVVTAARNRVRGVAGPGESSYSARPITPKGLVPSRFYVSLRVDDEPGVLAKIAAAFARQQVSISAVRQEGEPGRPDGQGAKLAILTHAARVADMAAAAEDLRALPDVRGEVAVMRVEG